MVMTPLELETRKFGRSLRGYNNEEVDQFIHGMLSDYEALYRENQELKDQCEAIRQELRRYKSLESSINETLLIAQKAGEDSRNNAIKEAELIIKEAKVQAEALVAEVRGEVLREQKELEEVRKQYELFSSELKILLMTYLELLEKNRLNYPQEFHEESEETTG